MLIFPEKKQTISWIQEKEVVWRSYRPWNIWNVYFYWKRWGERVIFVYTVYCTCNSKKPFLFFKNALTIDQKHPFWGIWRTWGNFKQLPVIDVKIKKEYFETEKLKSSVNQIWRAFVFFILYSLKEFIVNTCSRSHNYTSFLLNYMKCLVMNNINSLHCKEILVI